MLGSRGDRRAHPARASAPGVDACAAVRRGGAQTGRAPPHVESAGRVRRAHSAPAFPPPPPCAAWSSGPCASKESRAASGPLRGRRASSGTCAAGVGGFRAASWSRARCRSAFSMSDCAWAGVSARAALETRLRLAWDQSQQPFMMGGIKGK